MPDPTALDTINQNPTLKPIYTKLKSVVVSLGDITIEPKKTSLHVKARAGFAGIHPRKDYLILQIVADHAIKDAQVVKVEKVSANRVHNHLELRSPNDINAQVKVWLQQAYTLMA